MRVRAGGNETAEDLLIRACTISTCLAETLSIQFDAELELSSVGREGLVNVLLLQEAMIQEAHSMIATQDGGLGVPRKDLASLKALESAIEGRA